VKTSLLLLLCLPLSFFSSCLTSLYNLTTHENIICDQRLDGIWQQEHQTVRIEELNRSSYNKIFAEARASNAPFSEADSIFVSKHYVITIRESGFEYIWIGSLTRVGNMTYVSLTADACLVGDQDLAGRSGLLDSYSFASVEWMGDELFRLRFLNGDYLKDAILGGKIHVKHEYDPLFGTFVINAPPEDLGKFLAKYGSDQRLYEGGKVLTLTRKST